jgi:hypothetical protein
MRIISDAWVSPVRIPGGHLPVHVQFDVPSLSTKGWFWKQPAAYEVPPLPKKMSEADLVKEAEAKNFSQQGIEALFNLTIRSNDSENERALVNVMMDRYLECRELQEGVPRKEEPKEHIRYVRKPVVPKASKDCFISFEEKTSSALIRRMNEMLALKKLILANHAMTDKFNTQMLHLWVKVKRGESPTFSPLNKIWKASETFLMSLPQWSLSEPSTSLAPEFTPTHLLPAGRKWMLLKSCLPTISKVKLKPAGAPLRSFVRFRFRPPPITSTVEI